MELLILVPILGLLALYIAYKEWLNIAYRQWQAEMDLFKRRLAAYDELKSAVGGVSAGPAAAPVDTERFAQAMSDMRFLFDEDVERFVGGLYDSRAQEARPGRAAREGQRSREGARRSSADRASSRQEPRVGEPNQQRHLSGNAGAYGEVHAAPASLVRGSLDLAAGHAIASAGATRTFETSLAKPGRLASDFGPGIPVSGGKLSGGAAFCNNSKRFAG